MRLLYTQQECTEISSVHRTEFLLELDYRRRQLLRSRRDHSRDRGARRAGANNDASPSAYVSHRPDHCAYPRPASHQSSVRDCNCVATAPRICRTHVLLCERDGGRPAAAYVWIVVLYPLLLSLVFASCPALLLDYVPHSRGDWLALLGRTFASGRAALRSGVAQRTVHRPLHRILRAAVSTPCDHVSAVGLFAPSSRACSSCVGGLSRMDDADAKRGTSATATNSHCALCRCLVVPCIATTVVCRCFHQPTPTLLAPIRPLSSAFLRQIHECDGATCGCTCKRGSSGSSERGIGDTRAVATTGWRCARRPNFCWPPWSPYCCTRAG
jgi:hypothetical protein